MSDLAPPFYAFELHHSNCESLGVIQFSCNCGFPERLESVMSLPEKQADPRAMTAYEQGYADALADVRALLRVDVV